MGSFPWYPLVGVGDKNWQMVNLTSATPQELAPKPPDAVDGPVTLTHEARVLRAAHVVASRHPQGTFRIQVPEPLFHHALRAFKRLGFECASDEGTGIITCSRNKVAGSNRLQG